MALYRETYKNIIKDADRVPIGTTLRIPELTPKK